MFRKAARISNLARMINSRKLFVSPVSKLVRESDIRQTLQKEFPGADVVVTDTSDGCGSNFSIEITSDLFEGKRAVNRNRMVNRAIKPYLEQIHALRLSLVTNEEKQNES